MSTPTPPSSQLEEDLDQVVRSSGPASDKIQELMQLLAKSRGQPAASSPGTDEDCPDEDEDCRGLLSPCCGASFRIVFGSLPTKVECLTCGTGHLLRDLVSSI